MLKTACDIGVAWALWRQDDNGNRFLIRTVESEGEAMALLGRYEGLGHKQLYWVETAEARDFLS